MAEKNGGRRRAGQVIANGGVAAIAGFLAFILPANQFIFQVILAAALSSAMADTLSSELGIIYGKNFYDVLTFKPGIRGENGVISTEGTCIGLAGSVLIALIFCFFFGFKLSFCWIIISGTVGNLADSILGALLERRRYLNNNAVNFLNTFIAAMTAFLLLKLS